MARMSDLTRPARTAAYTPLVFGNRWGQLLDGRPSFTWLEAERMRLDPQVQLGLRILRAPLYGVTWKVRADDARAEGWINREMKAIYANMLPKLCRHFEYGVACGEVTFVRRRGRVHFKDFLDVHPQDCRPYLHRGGSSRAGKIAALEVKNVGSAMGGGRAIYLDRRHAFWFKGDTEFGEWWGRPRLASAYQPWFDKGSRHAANDAIRLFYRKQAFRGPTLYYPVGTTDVGTPESGPIIRNNQDIAREIVEKFQNGGVLALPSTLDEKGQLLWRWEDPKGLPDVPGLLDYKKSLDRDILVALGIPPELVDAATVGSGYSGRAIPAQVFFCSMDEESARMVKAIDEQILRYLVRLNFGPIGYSITPESLAKLVAGADPHGPQPLAGSAGAGTPGQQPGKPVEQIGPRGGHQILGPGGKIRYGHVRLSMRAKPSIDAAAAKKLWDGAPSPIQAPAGSRLARPSARELFERSPGPILAPLGA